MFEAQRLFKGDTAIVSPWFPRGGDRLIATLDIVDWNAAGTSTQALQLRITVETKNHEDSGDGAGASASAAITVRSDDATNTGRFDEEWDGATDSAGLLELVRYKFTIADGKTDADSVLFRMLAPVWYDAVTA